MSILKSVQSIPLSNGGYIKINSLIGEGGQGEVYSVEYNKSAYALKWYKQNMSSAFYENLKNNILSGVPNKNFLWPKAITGIHQGKLVLQFLRQDLFQGEERLDNLSSLGLECSQLCGKNHQQTLTRQIFRPIPSLRRSLL